MEPVDISADMGTKPDVPPVSGPPRELYSTEKVGGSRLLVILPNMGYGGRALGSIKPNETVIFVVDLLKLG